MSKPKRTFATAVAHLRSIYARSTNLEQSRLIMAYVIKVGGYTGDLAHYLDVYLKRLSREPDVESKETLNKVYNILSVDWTQPEVLLAMVKDNDLLSTMRVSDALSFKSASADKRLTPWSLVGLAVKAAMINAAIKWLAEEKAKRKHQDKGYDPYLDIDIDALEVGASVVSLDKYWRIFANDFMQRTAGWDTPIEDIEEKLLSAEPPKTKSLGSSKFEEWLDNYVSVLVSSKSMMGTLQNLLRNPETYKEKAPAQIGALVKREPSYLGEGASPDAILDTIMSDNSLAMADITSLVKKHTSVTINELLNLFLVEAIGKAAITRLSDPDYASYFLHQALRSVPALESEESGTKPGKNPTPKSKAPEQGQRIQQKQLPAVEDLLALLRSNKPSAKQPSGEGETKPAIPKKSSFNSGPKYLKFQGHLYIRS